MARRKQSTIDDELIDKLQQLSHPRLQILRRRMPSLTPPHYQ